MCFKSLQIKGIMGARRKAVQGVRRTRLSRSGERLRARRWSMGGCVLLISGGGRLGSVHLPVRGSRRGCRSHGGGDVLVAKELLDGADVAAVFEEVRGERMSL